MPNIRIKDIPTTASATSSTDFIAIDGATNGTRKLSADSPVFGGNVTVNGGTVGTAASTNLTLAGGSSGASLVLRQGGSGYANVKSPTARATSGNPIAFSVSSNDPENADLGLYVRLNTAAASASRYASIYCFDNGVGAAALTLQHLGSNVLIGGTTDISGSGGLKVFGTTASTSTTTGALQVAGGVGVAGAINLGTKLQIDTHTTSAGGIGFGTETSLFRVAAGKLGVSHIGGTTPQIDLYAGTTLRAYFVASGTDVFLSSQSGGLYLRSNNATALTLDTSQNATFVSTTASTSTTTGALTVAGGVGVAGALFTGGNIVSTGAGTHYLAADATSAGSATLYLKSTSGASYIGFNESFNIGTIASVGGAVTSVLSLTSTGNLTTGGSISTSAPTGGAGAWELGVANTVTPTAPNRTITIEIGGTVFYLHAKTTND